MFGKVHWLPVMCFKPHPKGIKSRVNGLLYDTQQDRQESQQDKIFLQLDRQEMNKNNYNNHHCQQNWQFS